MKQLVALYSFLIIFQLSIAASTHDQKQEKIFSSEDAPVVLSRRSVVEFGFMISCHTKRSPLLYIGYGCYCGIGGKGKPKDDTDRCCQVHDQCYRSVKDSGVCPFHNAVYVFPYSRKNCYQCEPSSHYWFYGKCRYATCKCDSEAVQCFKRSKFNPSLKRYPQNKC